MSYTYNNEIKYSDNVNLDAFGRLRISQITTLLDIKHLYDKLPLVVDEEIGGGATSVWSAPFVNMSTSANNDYVIRQTIKSAPYQSGKGQLFEASFSNFALQTNIIKRIGYFTSTTSAPFNSGFDGFFLESNGVTGIISFQIWKGGTNILTANTSSWYTTEYDVALIDWTKSQLLMVDFQWLSVGRVRFYMVVDGIPKLFYAHSAVNNLTGAYMNNSNKPIRFEIRQSGAGSGSLAMICAGVSMEGAINQTYYSLSLNDFTERTLIAAGTTYAMLGVRLNASTPYPGVSTVLSQIDSLQTSNDNFLLTVQKNPTLSAAATWTDATGTPIQYSVPSPTMLSVTSAGHAFSSVMGKSGSVISERISLEDDVFSLGYAIDGTPEEWWICIQSTGANSKMRTGLNIKYFK